MRELRYRVVSFLGRMLIEALLRTVRFRIEHAERHRQYTDHGKGVIFTLWHGRLLPATYVHRDQGVAAVISRSADGEYIARVVEGWGYSTIRGSSSRGGREALRGMIRAARAGRSLAITPDGPRGPRQKLQPGVLHAAQRTGLPIVPVTAGASRAWWPGSWDRFCVPRPFARVRVLYGEPRYVPRDAGEDELRRHAAELEAQMNEMVLEVDRDGGPDR